MIRVLHFVGSLEAGGLETLIMNLYRKIDTSKVQFDFVVHHRKIGLYEEEIINRGGKIYHLTLLDDKNIFKYKKQLTKILKDGNYKIVHGHHSSLGSIYLKVAKKAGVPVRISHSHIASFSKTLKGYVKFFITRGFGKNATHHFACSKWAGEYMYGKNGKFNVINNGIDTEKFKFNSDYRIEKRKSLNIENDFAVCHVGRFHDQKNHNFIIDVFKDICKLNPASKLLLIGIGPLEDTIKTKVENYGLSDKVLFLGQITDVNKVLSAADAFLFPSLYEGLPLTLVEAQTAGLPVVCSDTITDECHITDEYYVLPLDTPTDKWAETVVETADLKIPREDRCRVIKEKGYDSGDVADSLVKFYTDSAEACV